MNSRYRFFIFVFLILGTSGCRRTDKIKLEATDESAATLASTVHAADPKSAIQLLRGFHGIENNSWRWTAGQFAVTVRPPTGGAEIGAIAVLKFSLPESVMSQVKATTLSLTIDGTELSKHTYNAPGEYVFTTAVPAALLKPDAVTLTFALDRYLKAGTVDQRELGVVFLSCGLESK